MKRFFYLCFLFLSYQLLSQDGSPDLSFGNNGYLVYQLDGDEHFIQGALETVDGKILTLINTNINSNSVSKILAFNDDGLPYLEFGIDGALDVTNVFGDINGMINLNGNGFLLHGTFNNQLVMSKHFDDGSLDDSFGDNGFIQGVLNEGSGNRVVIDEENRIIVSGKEIVSGVQHVIMKRFTENGLPDASFGSNGEVLFPLIGMANPTVSSLIVKGNYYYSGINLNDNIGQQRSIVRSDLNGNIDTNFGTDGILQIPFEFENSKTNFDVFDNETILIGTFFFDDFTFNIFRKTVKLNTQGQQIQDFGTNGEITDGRGFHIQGNQRFLATAHYIDFEGGATLNYYRYFSNGAIDNSFQFSSNYSDVIGSSVMLHLQNGKIMIISSDIWYNWPANQIALQRFNNNPLSIPSFENRSISIYPNPSNGVFQLHNNFPFDNDFYEVFDISGKKIKSGFLIDNFPSIDLSNFAGGVYFLKVNNIPQNKLLKK